MVPKLPAGLISAEMHLALDAVMLSGIVLDALRMRVVSAEPYVCLRALDIISTAHGRLGMVYQHKLGQTPMLDRPQLPPYPAEVQPQIDELRRLYPRAEIGIYYSGAGSYLIVASRAELHDLMQRLRGHTLERSVGWAVKATGEDIG